MFKQSIDQRGYLKRVHPLNSVSNIYIEPREKRPRNRSYILNDPFKTYFYNTLSGYYDTMMKENPDINPIKEMVSSVVEKSKNAAEEMYKKASEVGMALVEGVADGLKTATKQLLPDKISHPEKLIQPQQSLVKTDDDDDEDEILIDGETDLKKMYARLKKGQEEFNKAMGDDDDESDVQKSDDDFIEIQGKLMTGLINKVEDLPDLNLYVKDKIREKLSNLFSAYNKYIGTIIGDIDEGKFDEKELLSNYIQNYNELRDYLRTEIKTVKLPEFKERYQDLNRLLFIFNIPFAQKNTPFDQKNY